MQKKITLGLFALLLIGFINSPGYSQEIVRYNHNYLDPYFNNPSYLGNSGYTSLTLDYRHQWLGIEGAPTTTSLLFHLPFNHKMSAGINLSNDEFGSFNTIRSLATFGYKIYLGREASIQHYVGFGLSAGVNRTTLDMNDVNPSDPVAVDLLNSNYTLDGQFGLHYRYGNFELGFALPRLVKTPYVSTQSFNEIQFEQFSYTYTTLRYRLDIGHDFAFEPWVGYRTIDKFDNQISGTGVFYYKDILWAGGSYEQNSGVSFFIGFSVGRMFKAAYSYELASDQTPEIGQGTHDFLLMARIGKTDKLADVRSGYIKEKKLEPEEEKPEVVEPVDEIKEESPPVAPVVEEEIEEIPEKPVPEIEEVIVPEEIIESPPEQIVKEPESIVIDEISADEELEPGHYVIVGAFRVQENAINYMNEVIAAGYPGEIKYHKVKELYYVSLAQQGTIDNAKSLLENFRKSEDIDFKEAWILSIE